MKLALKIAAGIILGFTILWIANVGFAVSAISSLSAAVSEKLSTTKTKQLQPPATNLVSTVAPIAPVITTKTRPPKRIIGYRQERIAGRPLDQCLGPDKELNADVLRCRNGYMKKIPIFNQ